MKANSSSIQTSKPINPRITFTRPVRSRPSVTNKSPITLREGECLSWAAVGKTANEIADLLHISEHTVHYHTKNTVKKLNASNKTHAVVIAILAKYITVK